MTRLHVAVEAHAHDLQGPPGHKPLFSDRTARPIDDYDDDNDDGIIMVKTTTTTIMGMMTTTTTMG